jgi:hypothetical protein
LGSKRSLSDERGRDRVVRAREGRVHSIAYGLEDDPVMASDDLLEHGVVSSEGLAHGGAVPLDELSRAFDVAEEEGDGTFGQAGHRDPW